jgi:hypothetical protein
MLVILFNIYFTTSALKAFYCTLKSSASPIPPPTPLPLFSTSASISLVHLCLHLSHQESNGLVVEPVLNRAVDPGLRPRLRSKCQRIWVWVSSWRANLCSIALTCSLPISDWPGESRICRLYMCLRGLRVSGVERSQFSHTVKVFRSPCNRCIATNAYVTPLL